MIDRTLLALSCAAIAALVPRVRTPTKTLARSDATCDSALPLTAITGGPDCPAVCPPAGAAIAARITATFPVHEPTRIAHLRSAEVRHGVRLWVDLSRPSLGSDEPTPNPATLFDLDHEILQVRGADAGDCRRLRQR